MTLWRMGRVALVLALYLVVLTPTPGSAQAPTEASLERAAQQVAWLWAQGDVGGLADYAARDGRVTVDLGSVSGAASWRHTAATLRSLFGDRETSSARVQETAMSSGSPPRGFGEIAWLSRMRGTREPQRHTVYVGFSWEEGAWRIREIRLLR